MAFVRRLSEDAPSCRLVLCSAAAGSLLGCELSRHVSPGHSKPELSHCVSAVSDMASEKPLRNGSRSTSSNPAPTVFLPCPGTCGKAQSLSTTPPSTDRWCTREGVSAAFSH